MVSGTGSSKRKSSPLLEKKRRTKDRSKKRSKIGRGKSKKVHRREIPDTYLDDESLSSGSSVPCSSTDNDRRRSRSRTRKGKSKSTKKSRRSPVRSESSEDTIRDRRSKRFKKSKGTDAKRKGVRKKRKREPSISSVSCSTCRSSDDSEREDEKRAKRRTRSRRELEDDRILCGHRSRSSSSCRLDGGDGSYVSEKQGEDENNTKRLRSIIIFAKDCEEADTDVLDRDVQKEEIIYDHDDYPSPRSNDSNEGDIRTVVCLGETDINVQSVNASGLEEQETNVSSAGNDGSSAIDLETILRQKALENLRKFKGGLRANAKKLVSTKNSYDGEVKQSPGLNADGEGIKRSASQSVQTLPKDSDKVNADDESLENNEVLKDEHLGADKLAKQILPTTQESSVVYMETTKSLSLPTKDVTGIINSDVIQESSVPAENKETVESAQPCHDTKMVTDVDQATSGVSKSSNVTGNGDEEGSQFEQKTMSVMRGGEMVQVSYKVYIPKRAPALARRKLRR